MEIKAPLIKRGRTSEYIKVCFQLAMITFVAVLLCNIKTIIGYL